MQRKVMFGLKTAFNNILELQKIDIQIDNLNKRLANLPENIRMDELNKEKVSWQAKKTAFETEKKEFELGFNKLKGQLDLLNQKIKKEQDKLYSGKVSNPKELSSIQHELELLNNNRDELETKVLEQMDKEAAYGSATDKVNSRLSVIEDELTSTKEAAAKKEAEISKQIEELKPNREAIAAEVDPDWLAEYEDIKKRKDGIAAAELIEGVCQVCHVQIPATEVDEISKKNEPDYCPSCGRILIT